MDTAPSGNRLLNWTTFFRVEASWAFAGYLGIPSAVGAVIAALFNAWMVWIPLTLLAAVFLVPLAIMLCRRAWKDTNKPTTPLVIDLTEAVNADAMETIEKDDRVNHRTRIQVVAVDIDRDGLQRQNDPVLSIRVEFFNASVFTVRQERIEGRVILNGDVLGGEVELLPKPIDVHRGETGEAKFRQWLSPSSAELINLTWPKDIDVTGIRIVFRGKSPTSGTDAEFVMALPNNIVFEQTRKRWCLMA